MAQVQIQYASGAAVTCTEPLQNISVLGSSRVAGTGAQTLNFAVTLTHQHQSVAIAIATPGATAGTVTVALQHTGSNVPVTSPNTLLLGGSTPANVGATVAYAASVTPKLVLVLPGAHEISAQGVYTAPLSTTMRFVVTTDATYNGTSIEAMIVAGSARHNIGNKPV